MDFSIFDKSEMEQYKSEAKARWGDTSAYKEYEENHAKQNESSYEQLTNDMMAIFSELGTMKHMSPADNAVQAKIATLQEFITEHYYTCTNEILSGLGDMYVSDERFRKNIDNAGGAGTADFVKQAISVYCGK